MIKAKKTGLHTFMAVPAFLLFALFFIYPLTRGIQMSLTDWDGLSPAKFIGFRNFIDFFSDERAISDIKTTVLFALCSAPLLNIVGLIYALLMNAEFKGKGLARGIIYLPAVISPLIMGYIWYFLLQPGRGFLFHALDLVGMIKITDGKAVDVGPRSAHIAGLEYEVFAAASDMLNPVLKSVKPSQNDPEYAYVECSNGKKYALTLTGAANLAGYVSEGDYARGNLDVAACAWKPLADNMKMTVKEAAETVLVFSAAKNGAVVKALIHDYSLDPKAIVFVGGGGGASTVVPHLGETFGCNFKLARNSSVISPIGVALAMVRDMVERTIANPTEEDILTLRREALRQAVQSGANPDTVEVKIEIDTQLQKVRAIAIGTTELRTKDLNSARKTDEELKTIVARSLNADTEQLTIEADNGSMCAISCEVMRKHLIFFKKKTKAIRLIDREGVIRLQKKNAVVLHCKSNEWKSAVKKLLVDNTVFGDGGAEIPNIYVVSGSRIIDVSGMQDEAQITALCSVELADVQAKEELIMICTMSRTTLYTLAQQYLECGILDYIRKKRIKYAQNLPANTQLPVTVISDKAGFSDYSYFRRVFKQETGTSW